MRSEASKAKLIVDEQWLAQYEETALEPDLEIVDPHHHLWQHPPQRPMESYVLEDYIADLRKGHRQDA